MTSNNITRFFFLLCACFLQIPAHAQQYSYVYIQGDKTLPFYVKLGDEMLPRYGKNYFILPMLEAGEINIEVLFQQNKYPPEHFTIKVPENSSRSFLLSKKDGAYSLYDLQQGFYLDNGNSADQDRLPTAIAKTNAQAIDSMEMALAPAPAQKEIPATPKKQKGPLLRKAKKSAPVSTDNGPVFIDDIELRNQHHVETPEEKAQKEETTSTPTDAQEQLPPSNPSITKNNTSTTTNNTVTNTDCQSPADDETLEKIYKKAMAEVSEESRLGYLLQQADHCFSTSQLRLLAKSLDKDTARYALLKKMYPRTTDQTDFSGLEDLFSSEEWRNYFKQITSK